MTNLIAVMQTLGKPLAYYPSVARALDGDITLAVLICQLAYWTPRARDPDGWVYKTIAEWSEETGITERTVRRAKDRGVELGLLESDRRGFPPVTHLRLVPESIESLLINVLPNRSKRGASDLANMASLGTTDLANMAATSGQSGQIRPIYLDRDYSENTSPSLVSPQDSQSHHRAQADRSLAEKPSKALEPLKPSEGRQEGRTSIRGDSVQSEQSAPVSAAPAPKRAKKPAKRKPSFEELLIATFHGVKAIDYFREKYPAYDGNSGRLSLDEKLDTLRDWHTRAGKKAWVSPAGINGALSRDYDYAKRSYDRDIRDSVVAPARPPEIPQEVRDRRMQHEQWMKIRDVQRSKLRNLKARLTKAEGDERTEIQRQIEMRNGILQGALAWLDANPE